MPWLPKQSIVVPVDFSASSIEAIRVALEFVDHPSCIHVVHVVVPRFIADPGIQWGKQPDRERVTVAEQKLEERLRDEGLSEPHREVVLGNPAQAIAGVAGAVNAELIVIPSHGRSGFSRLLLGSVTEKVLRMAECQVLVLRVAE